MEMIASETAELSTIAAHRSVGVAADRRVRFGASQPGGRPAARHPATVGESVNRDLFPQSEFPFEFFLSFPGVIIRGILTRAPGVDVENRRGGRAALQPRGGICGPLRQLQLESS